MDAKALETDSLDAEARVAVGTTQVVSDQPDATNGLERKPAREPGLLALFLPSYLLGLSLLAAMVLAAGFWNVIANTRILAGLIAAGVVALGEDDPGIGTGVPGVNFWIRSEEPVTWLILLLAAALFATVAVLKGVQFHRIARFIGIDGSLSQHLRAFLYGHGLGRMLPYRLGEVAWASVLEAQGGASLPQSARLVFIFKGFLLFEIATFALIGFVMSGLLDWAQALVVPLLILLASWLLMRPQRQDRQPTGSVWQNTGQVLAELGREPQLFVGLVLLSLVSFTLVEIASYIVPQAFTSPVVLLIQDELRFVVVTTPVIVMAVVGGYIARLIPVTPGGIGQFELGFAAVLMINDLPLPEAVVVALLVSGVRYATGAMLFGGTMLGYGIETNFRRVRSIFSRPNAAVGEEA